MCRWALTAVALLFGSHALGGQVPSADELFARLRERAQRLNGLRCILEVESLAGDRQDYEEESGLPRRRVLEFRAPGHLRAESLPRDDSSRAKALFKPEIAVLTPNEQWTYLPWRDELILGQPDLVAARGYDRRWEAYPRVFGALLAPDALYKEHDIRRVFPDVLRGRHCYLVLLAKEGLPADYLWIEPERWTILRLNRVCWSLGAEDGSDNSTVVAEHKEIAPGVWLPAVIHRRWDESGAGGPVRVRTTAIEPGYTAALERFAAPTVVPLLRRSACLGNAQEVWESLGGAEDHWAVGRIHECYVDPGQRENTSALPHLKSFVARNPRIRAGYYELSRNQGLHTQEGLATLEAALKLWPEDLSLRVTVFQQRYYRDPSAENAAALAPYAWPQFDLMDRLDRQARAGDHAAAKLTARELLGQVAATKPPPMRGLRSAAYSRIHDAAKKGGWVNELRAECERRAAADPPSELHLRLLLHVAYVEGEGAPRWAALARRLAELRRDSPEVQLECSGRRTLDILSRLLDSLPADDFLHREAALSRLRDIRDPAATPMADQGRPDPVRELLEAELQQRRETLTREQRLWRYRVLAACHEDHLPRAAACLRQAIELAPEDEALKFRLLAHLVKMGERAEARAFFERLVADHPGRPELWLAWQRQLDVREDPEFAQRVVQGLLACAPTNEATYALAQQVCSELGRFAEAAKWALKKGDRVEAARHLMRAHDAPGALALWLDELQRARRRPAPDAERKAGYVKSVVRAFAALDLAEKLQADWLAQQWLPALTAAVERLGPKGPAEERAALHFALGSACRALRQHQRAAQHYARGVKLLPKFDEGRRWLDEIAPGYPLDDF